MRNQKKRRTIPFNFGAEHKEYIRKCESSTYNILEGAVRSGKTIDNVFAFAHELKTTPDRLHLATGSTVANAKLNIGDANGFGLEYIFRGQCRWGKYKDNDCLRIKGASTGWKEKIVIFAGGGKRDSYKRIRGNSYGLWIATEINLHHDNTIKEAFNRQLAAKRRKIFWDLNPSNPNASIYADYIDKYKQMQEDGTLLGGYNYEHFTIFQNVNIPRSRIDEIVSQYDKNSIWYMRDILGERTIAEGLIYPQYKEAIGSAPEGMEFTDWALFCDYGTRNAFAGLLFGRGTDGIWYGRKEYYYDGHTARKRKTDADYASDLEAFTAPITAQYEADYALSVSREDPFAAKKKLTVVVDPSALSFITEMQKHGVFKIRHADNDVEDGIRETDSAMQHGFIKIDPCMKNTISEFGGYVWDEAAAEKGIEKPVKVADHAMDALRYGVKTMHILRQGYRAMKQKSIQSA